MPTIFHYYYKRVLVDGCNPKHFWFEKSSWPHNTPLFSSRDGKMYSIFYADPKERMAAYTWTAWFPFLLFIKDEWGE